MPLQRDEPVVEAREQRVVTPLVGELDLEQADLRALGRVHAARRARPRAAARRGRRRGTGVPASTASRTSRRSAREPRVLGVVAGAHRSAHRQHRVELAPVRQRLALVDLDRDRPPPRARAITSREHARVLAGDVLEDEQRASAHGACVGPARRVLLLAELDHLAAARVDAHDRELVVGLAVGAQDRERDDPERVPVDPLAQQPDLGVLGHEIDLLGGQSRRPPPG